MNPVCSSFRQIEHYPSLSNMYASIPLRTTAKADLSSPLIKYAKKNLSIVRFASILVSILGELQQSEIDALQRGGEPKNGAGHEEVHQRRHDHVVHHVLLLCEANHQGIPRFGGGSERRACRFTSSQWDCR